VPKMLRLLTVMMMAASNLALAAEPGSASMLAFFPEDVEVESEKGAGSDFNIPVLARLFTPVPQYRFHNSIAALQADMHRLYTQPPVTMKGETDLGCTAIAVFFEARGESILGQQAVASVVLQRAMTPERWGEYPCEVVRPVQFTFMTSQYGFPRITSEEGWRPSWATAIQIAADILINGPIPEIRGADHYHADYVEPDWRLAMPKTANIGQHLFYADPISQPTE